MTGFRGRADEKRLESDYAERYYARQSSSRRKAKSEAGRCGGCLGIIIVGLISIDDRCGSTHGILACYIGIGLSKHVAFYLQSVINYAYTK